MSELKVTLGSRFWAPTYSSTHPVSKVVGSLAKIEEASNLALIGQKAAIEYQRQSGEVMQEHLYRLEQNVLHRANDSNVTTAIGELSEGQDRIRDEIASLRGDANKITDLMVLSDNNRSNEFQLIHRGLNSVAEVGWLNVVQNERIHSGIRDISTGVGRIENGVIQVGEYVRDGFAGVTQCMAIQGNETRQLINNGILELAMQAEEVGQLLDSHLVSICSGLAATHSVIENIDLNIVSLLEEQQKATYILSASIKNVESRIKRQTLIFKESLDKILSSQLNKAELDAHKHFESGMSYMNGMRIDRALYYFNEALRKYGRHFYAKMMLAHIFYLRGQQQNCEEALLDALSIAKDRRHFFAVNFYLGRLYMEKKSFLIAETYFDASIASGRNLIAPRIEKIAAALLKKGEIPINATNVINAISYSFKGLYISESDIFYKIALITCAHSYDIAIWLGSYAISIDPVGRLRDGEAVAAKLKELDAHAHSVLISMLHPTFPWLSDALGDD
ncbi:MAG: hypothetical protein Q7R40_02840 [Phaeospirillum sp.]|nr:hypothetical protein [Phaeospirillum sp.]